MYELVPRPGCEPRRRMKAACSGGKESVARLVDCSTGTLMPTDSIWSWTAIQSLGMGVGSGVGSAVAVGPPEPVAPADGVGVASATGVAVGSGIGGRLETGEESRSSWPTIMRATPATASTRGSSMLDSERRMTRRSLATKARTLP